MNIVTNFADQAVVLPALVLVAAILLLLGRLHDAAAWAAVVAASYVLMLAGKLWFGACGGPIVHSPSGHTMAAPLLYGGVLALLGVSGTAVLLVTASIAALIGWSRVVLHDHDIAEVAIGGVVGLLAVATLLRVRQPRGTWRVHPARSLLLTLAAVAVPILLFDGQHSQAESLIQHVARSYVRPLLACGTAPRLHGGHAP